MKYFSVLFYLLPFSVFGQPKLTWQNVDSAFAPLPKSVHIYFTKQAIDTASFKAYYVVADLQEKSIDFTTDTTLKRRLTPSQFFSKNNAPVVVINGAFFSFETNTNRNVVIKEGKILSYNQHTIDGKGKDTLTYWHPFPSTIGITKNREADIAWTVTDSASRDVYASQYVLKPVKDSVNQHSLNYLLQAGNTGSQQSASASFKKWTMQTAIGGGPVLVQQNNIAITNNEEIKFGGRAINDKHPRIAIGYTKDQKLIILAIEGRSKESGGATLPQTAQILKDLGCVEALNLDGGGSSCLLINGKETIRPSDARGQRPVPSVFMITRKD
ncbi:MAG: phosphodiester glycosidase family protein [Chitinophagaceae bacterium]|nr:MAG: phosphodiester glycosidase family protein [Chitinophagaceae bacterium]